jgi:hypothetical protein
MSGLMENDARYEFDLLKTVQEKQCLDISAIHGLHRTDSWEKVGDNSGITEEQRILIEQLTRAIDINGYLYIRSNVLEEAQIRY